MSRSDDELPSLEALQEQIDSVKDRNKQEGSENDPENPGRDTGLAMRVVSDLVAGLVVGGTIGYLIDRSFDTLPWFFILCFFVGAGAGFRNIYRSVGKEENT